MLTFDPVTGLIVQDTDAVRQSVQTDWKNALGQNLDVDASTAAGQLIDSETAIIVDKDSQVLAMSTQFDPYKNSGIWQDAIGHIYFIDRQLDQSSIVECECYGLANTVIPQNALVQTADSVMLYAVTGGTIPTGGILTLSFATQLTGSVIIAPNTVNKIVTVIAGWDTVNNPLAGVTGRAVESRADFEKRRRESVAKNGHGSLLAITGEILNITNVIDAYVIENTTSAPIMKDGVTIDPHSIFASVKGGGDADIAEAIYSKKDAGCGTTGNTTITYVDPINDVPYPYQIERPNDVNFGIQINLRLTPDTPSNIEQLLKTAMVADFNGTLPESTKVGIGDIVRAAEFYCVAISAGATGLSTIKVAARFTDINMAVWEDEIQLNADEFPLLAEANVIINEIT